MYKCGAVRCGEEVLVACLKYIEKVVSSEFRRGCVLVKRVLAGDGM